MSISTQHAPGPWIAQRRSGSDYGQEVVTSDKRQVIAETICSEHEANACLIAAAPELLAALKELLCWVQPLEAAALAAQAIAKAEGRTP